MTDGTEAASTLHLAAERRMGQIVPAWQPTSSKRIGHEAGCHSGVTHDHCCLERRCRMHEAKDNPAYGRNGLGTGFVSAQLDHLSRRMYRMTIGRRERDEKKVRACSWENARSAAIKLRMNSSRSKSEPIDQPDPANCFARLKRSQLFGIGADNLRARAVETTS